VKEEQSLRATLPALSRQILELAKTRGEINGQGDRDTTGANRNTIKAHLKKLAAQLYLGQSARVAERAIPSNDREPTKGSPIRVPRRAVDLRCVWFSCFFDSRSGFSRDFSRTASAHRSHEGGGAEVMLA